MKRMNDYKVRGMAIVQMRTHKNSFTTFMARTLIECDAEGYDDWQQDGGFYHNEGELNIDWSSARAVYPDEYEYIWGHKNTEGNRPIEEIIQVYEDTVIIEDWEIEQVDKYGLEEV